MPRRAEVFTVGYEGATVHTFLEALHKAPVELLVDVRAVASSRRPGFAKSAFPACDGGGPERTRLTPAPR